MSAPDPAATPKLRSTPLGASGYLIVRGIEPSVDEARYAAARFRDRFPGWNAFGLSGYYAATQVETDALFGKKLLAWSTVAIYVLEDLVNVGLTVSPTFRTPHVTVHHPDLDRLVTLLDGTHYEVKEKPHYQRHRRRRRHRACRTAVGSGTQMAAPRHQPPTGITSASRCARAELGSRCDIINALDWLKPMRGPH